LPALIEKVSEPDERRPRVQSFNPSTIKRLGEREQQPAFLGVLLARVERRVKPADGPTLLAPDVLFVG
jgi:hypothetical protein